MDGPGKLLRSSTRLNCCADLQGDGTIRALRQLSRRGAITWRLCQQMTFQNLAIRRPRWVSTSRSGVLKSHHTPSGILKPGGGTSDAKAEVDSSQAGT
jgi:hypothetical protein